MKDIKKGIKISNGLVIWKYLSRPEKSETNSYFEKILKQLVERKCRYSQKILQLLGFYFFLDFLHNMDNSRVNLPKPFNSKNRNRARI